MLTEQHYNRIAEALRSIKNLPPVVSQSRLIALLAVTFENDDPKFNRKRFYDTVFGRDK